MSSGTIRLLITCPDTRGIIAAVANFVAQHNGNILDADQHTDPHDRDFFMRIEIDPDGFGLDRRTFDEAWRSVADRFKMRWRGYWGGDGKRMAILVSKQDHCLQDLLWRWRTHELTAHIPLVIGNHDELRSDVEGCRLRFEHVPMTAQTREQSEGRMLGLLKDARVDFIVFARFMQILSPAF